MQRLIALSLRYPITDTPGRTATAGIVAGLVLVALCVRYAVVLSPTALALGPALLAVVATVWLAGILSQVLVDDLESSFPTVRTTIGQGVTLVAITVPMLGLPSAVVAASATRIVEVGTEPSIASLLASTGSFTLFLTAGYVLPVAVAIATRDGRIRTVVDTDVLWRTLSNVTYFVAWTVGFTFLTVAAAFASVTLVSTDVTGLLSAVVAAYLATAGTRALATGYDRSTDSSPTKTQ